MNIIFDEKTKVAMNELITKSSENHLKIKVTRGCGKPAYEIFSTFKSEDDEEIIIEGISFIYNKLDEKLIDGIEIKYDKELYNNGFYIKG